MYFCVYAFYGFTPDKQRESGHSRPEWEQIHSECIETGWGKADPPGGGLKATASSRWRRTARAGKRQREGQACVHAHRTTPEIKTVVTTNLPRLNIIIRNNRRLVTLAEQPPVLFFSCGLRWPHPLLLCTPRHHHHGCRHLTLLAAHLLSSGAVPIFVLCELCIFAAYVVPISKLWKSGRPTTYYSCNFHHSWRHPTLLAAHSLPSGAALAGELWVDRYGWVLA